jgi:hypothetical protein
MERNIKPIILIKIASLMYLTLGIFLVLNHIITNPVRVKKPITGLAK